jgi:hypothetical protein
MVVLGHLVFDWYRMSCYASFIFRCIPAAMLLLCLLVLGRPFCVHDMKVGQGTLEMPAETNIIS